MASIGKGSFHGEINVPTKTSAVVNCDDDDKEEEDSKIAAVVDDVTRRKEDDDDDEENVKDIAATVVEKHADDDASSNDQHYHHHHSKNNNSHVQFHTHYSCGVGDPCSTIRFRNKRILTYGLDRENQVLLQVNNDQHEHDDDDDDDNANHKSPEEETTTRSVTVKYYNHSTCGLLFLRTTYSLVALLVLGFIWAFCMQVILFLFMNVFAQGGKPTAYNLTTGDEDVREGTIDSSVLIGSLCSIPVFVYGFASMLAIGNSVVLDTWNGSPLFGQLLLGCSNNTKVVMEVICFVVFLGIPGMTLAVATLSKSDLWWETTLSVWVVDILVFMAFYALLVVWTETSTCLELTRLNSMLSLDVDHSWWTLILEALGNTQIMFYSGYERVLYLVASSSSHHHHHHDNNPKSKSTNNKAEKEQGGEEEKQQELLSEDDDDSSSSKTLIKSRSSIYSKLTVTGFCCCSFFFRTLKNPEKVYSNDDIQEVQPFFTSTHWSLERMFCRSMNRNNAVFVTRGRSSLKKSQIYSTVWCVLFANVLVVLLVAGLLVYMEFAVFAVVTIPLLVFVCCLLPVLVRTARLYFQMYGKSTKIANTNLNNNNDDHHLASNHGDWEPDDNDDENDDELLFHEWTSQRVSEPQPQWYWTCFILSQVVFFWYPFIGFMVVSKNYRVGAVFLVLAVFSWPRLYLHPLPILQRYGSIGRLRFYTNRNGGYSNNDNNNNNNNNNNSEVAVDDDDEAAQQHKDDTLLSRAVAYGDEGILNDDADNNNNNKSKTNNNNNNDEEEYYYLLRRRARLAALIDRVSDRDSMHCWMWFFGILIVLFGVFAWSASSQQQGEGFDYKVKVPAGETFLGEGFYYEPQDYLTYPTCRVSKNFDLTTAPEEEDTTQLMDVAWLAAMSFAAPNESVPLINQWYGTQLPRSPYNPWDRTNLNTTIVDEYEFVEEWKRANGITVPASFKFFTFPENPGAGLVSIRGSESLLDWLVDAQLWMGAGLAQIVRALIPFGWIFNPVLDELVNLINWVENENLKQISYYQVTTQFVNDMKTTGGAGRRQPYDRMRVTGASLGGGLAIITGAQTNATTVAISGLNAMLSRRTFRPPLTKEALDTHVMNVVPARDIIARIDDAADLTLRTQCRAPKNSLMGCHSMWRSVCETAYQCGSMGRPILCWCTKKYGYPDPLPYPNTTKTWGEACADWGHKELTD